MPDLLSVFNRQSGWEVEVIEDSIIELHPTFWCAGPALHNWVVGRIAARRWQVQ